MSDSDKNKKSDDKNDEKNNAGASGANDSEAVTPEKAEEKENKDKAAADAKGKDDKPAPGTDDKTPTKVDDKGAKKEDDKAAKPDPKNAAEGTEKKPDEPSAKKDDPSTKKDDPSAKKDDPSAKKDDPSVKKDDDPSAKKDDPSAKKDDEPSAKKDDPSDKKDDPSEKKDDPSAKKDDPSAKIDDATAKADKPSQASNAIKLTPSQDNLSLFTKNETYFPKCVTKGKNEQYADIRESVRMMMYLIDKRDRERVSAWLERLEKMVDEDGQYERLLYIKYLAITLSGSSGMMEPFKSSPPEVIRPLHLVLPSVVFADVMDEKLNEDGCVRRRLDHVTRAGMTPAKRTHQEDYQFYEQQLYPPEGMYCYAAAFSART